MDINTSVNDDYIFSCMATCLQFLKKVKSDQLGKKFNENRVPFLMKTDL